MPKLTWDKIGTRTYESGLDNGILYLPNGSAVPWNGLTSVVENFDKQTSPVYYDGMKINELMTLGDFSASLSAVTYPDEFEIFDGVAEIRPGMYAADQQPQSFALCYRTRVGNDVDGDESHYKLHVIYNLLAVPSNKTYASVSDAPEIVEFQWDITAVPEEVPGFRPTAHIIIDTSKTDPWLMGELYDIFYGSPSNFARLMPMAELLEYITTWFRLEIVDNGDGTWTANADRDGFIQIMDDFGMFTITQAKVTYLDEETFIIASTADARDIPFLSVTDNGDGTWSATTDEDNIIVMIDDTTFEIRNIDLAFEGPDMYRISDVTTA